MRVDIRLPGGCCVCLVRNAEQQQGAIYHCTLSTISAHYSAKYNLKALKESNRFLNFQHYSKVSHETPLSQKCVNFLTVRTFTNRNVAGKKMLNLSLYSYICVVSFTAGRRRSQSETNFYVLSSIRVFKKFEYLSNKVVGF